jgi:hypothetical protein
MKPNLDWLVLQEEGKMKVVAAYLLAVLGGNTSPSAEDVKNILGSGTLSWLLDFSYFLLQMGLEGCSNFTTEKKNRLGDSYSCYGH